jgi:sensor c-di-GMP phosphodiesterase-like protein
MITVLSGLWATWFYVKQAMFNDTNSRINQVIMHLDTIFFQAEKTASIISQYAGKVCTEKLRDEFKNLISNTPYISTISLINNNGTYCTTGTPHQYKQNILNSDKKNHLFIHTNDNRDFPGVTYAHNVNGRNVILIDIDGQYIANTFRFSNTVHPWHLYIGDELLQNSGEIYTANSIIIEKNLHSKHFEYSIIPDISISSILTWIISTPKGTLLLLVSFFICLFFIWAVTWFIKNQNATLTLLDRAIKLNQLVPYIQPIVDLRSGLIIGGEVLIRWKHPKKGYISPDNFIPAAENHEIIKTITKICLHEISSSFHASASKLPPGLLICINVSQRHFMDDEILQLCTKFINNLDMLNIQPVLELTERVLIETSENSSDITARLKRAGVKLSLDDFGTRNSNHAYVKQFSPDFIKIDKSFIQYIITDPASAAIVNNIIDLGSRFDCTIIAEGVENDNQRRLLQQAGVNLMQGYLFSHPLPLREFIDCVERRR